VSWRRGLRQQDIVLARDSIPTMDGEGRQPVFVAYPYALDPDYRGVLRGLESEFLVKFRFADDQPHATHILDNVERILMEASLAIFDLSGRNPNVYLELGMLRGMVGARFGRVWFIADMGTEIPSDLGGLRYAFRYSNLEELRSNLRERLRTATSRPLSIRGVRPPRRTYS
jgi:hypothetical protein